MTIKIKKYIYGHFLAGNYRDVYDLILKSNDVLIKNGLHLDTVLETLNYQLHSLGVLAVLVAKFSLLPVLSNHDLLFIQVQDFINGCNGEQVRFAPEICEYGSCNFYFCTVWRREIETAVTKICHYFVLFKTLQECLLCHLKGSQFDAEYFLRYYYYGGMIYTALKNLERAIYFYEVAVTTPALAVSHIMLEAYKKYILVSLIMHGKVGALPKYTSQVVSRFIRPASQPYHELATAYATTRTADVQNVLQKYAEIFSRENNTGLAKQVLTSLTKKNIQRLTKTFLTLSLSDVASRVQLPGPSDAERLILNMIEDNEIFATINQKDGMVIFHEDPEKYNSPNMLQRLRSENVILFSLMTYKWGKF
ncbi:UNVERIFIED_CONTAM: hypothetical protein B566_EDAN019543 [Ephemera danica]|nr:hypothetical protein B566_EDAN019543 [Ephemera danica]